MGRLTKRVEDTWGRKCIGIGVHYAYKFNWFYEALEKLAHYEDLEEAGRLIELPCAVGEEVWIGHKIYSFGESVVNVMYGSVSSIIIAMQDGFVFGRTKEEAEAKLKELEGVKSE
jgi:hypothetical protein